MIITVALVMMQRNIYLQNMLKVILSRRHDRLMTHGNGPALRRTPEADDPLLDLDTGENKNPKDRDAQPIGSANGHGAE